jgi:hypothetical protein
MSNNEQPASAHSRPPFWRSLSPGWALTVLALLVWLFVHDDYGITWDESVQSSYGEAVRTYFSGGQSFAEFSHSPNLPENIFSYGPALDLCCAEIAHTLGADIFSVRHGIQGLMWVALFYPVCGLGRRLSGRIGAWCAGFALLGMPALLGHAFNNPKDLPLACAAIWMLHVSVAAASARQLNWSHVLKLGGAAGFVLATRPGAWFLCVLLALVPMAVCWRNRKVHGKSRVLMAFAGTLPVLGAAVVLGWILMVLPWPNAWHSPLLYPINAALYALHFNESYPVLFRGNIYHSNHLPWDYLANYLALTQPLPLLVLALGGQWVLWQKAFRSTSKAVAALGVAFLLWFPMSMFILLRPNLYDGMRHFLFILPAFAVFAGIAAAQLVQRLHRFPQKRVLLGAFVLLLSAVPDLVRLHPYQNVYYNCLAGPRHTLHERYETDYWLSSYRAAALWINSAQSHHDRPLRVLVTGNESCLPAFTHFLDKKVKPVRVRFGDFSSDSLPSDIDYYVTTTRMGQWRNFPVAPIVFRNERDGILLAVIRGNSAQ